MAGNDIYIYIAGRSRGRYLGPHEDLPEEASAQKGSGCLGRPPGRYLADAKIATNPLRAKEEGMMTVADPPADPPKMTSQRQI